MTIDVLAYNSLNAENQQIRTCNTTLDSNVSTLNSQCASYLTCICNNVPSVINGKALRPEMWSLIETGSGWTAGFKVCDPSGYFRCGNSCTWVVPAGVTCARFQIWGAGGQSGAAGCCGGSPFGGSGAYASVIIPVSAGWSYTLCAGCANCCYAQWNTAANQNGCQSYVTGCNLSNFCANGGIGSLCQEQIDRGIYYSRTSPIPAIATYSYLGYCLCGTGSSYCANGWSTPFGFAWWSGAGTAGAGPNGAGTCGYGSGYAGQPHLSYQAEHSSALAYGSATGGVVYGISGSYGEMCINHYCHCGYAKAPPIYGFESSSQCLFIFTGSTSSGGNYCSANATFGSVTPSLLIPGAGGFAQQVNGGCVSLCGDAGRMGMVCVCYK